MNRGTWCTKEDVQKDLEVASGRKVIDVDDNCFVVGEQPPPRRMFSDEDDEIELRFGRGAHAQKLDQEGDPGPDLNGITKMLRMVQEYEQSPEEERRTPENITPNNRIILISKLNPNVKEFIPRTTQSPSSHNETVALSTKDASDKTTEIVNASMHCNIKNNEAVNATIVNDFKSDDDDSEKAAKEKKKQMAIKYKNKISAKKETFEEMRQSNLAIVNLLKLYAKSEPQATEPAAKPLKLLTPQFFQTRKASDNFEETSKTLDSSFGRKVSLPSEVKSNKDSLDQMQNSIANIKKDSVDEAYSSVKNNEIATFRKNENKLDSTVLHKENTKTEHLDEATSLTPDMADATIVSDQNIPSIVVKEPVDPNVADSINKVNNWLKDKPYLSVCEKEKPKGPALFFSTVTYKRKDSVTCKSPSEVADKKIPKSSEGSYKPSSYAEELLKKYNERNKKPTPSLNIWEKLEEDLKKKDREIKNRKK